MAAFELPLTVRGSQGCGASGVSLLGRDRRVLWCHLGSRKVWGATRNAGTSSLAALGGNLPCGAESLPRQRVPALLRSGCWYRVAALWWPFLQRGCFLSAACFLQPDPKQGPSTVPSSNRGGLCRSPGEFWKERQAPASGSAVLTCALSVATQVGHPKGGRHQEQQGHTLGSGCWRWWFCGDTEPLLLPTAWRRAGPGLAQVGPVPRQLSGASETEPLSCSCASSCWLPARPAALLRQCGCGSAGLVLSVDGLLLAFSLQQEGAAAASRGEGGCPGPLPCGAARPLPRRQGRWALAAAGRSLGSPWQPSARRTARSPGPSR